MPSSEAYNGAASIPEISDLKLPETPFGMPAENYYEIKGVKHFEETFQNSRGINLFRQSWIPAKGNPRALLVMCHGYGNDTSWLFQVSGIEFASQGYAVFTYDYEGHGQSGGVRAGIRKFDYLVEDTLEYCRAIKSRSEFQGLQCFFYGESLGGAVVIMAARKEATLCDGAILASPMCKISDSMQPHWLLVKALQWAVLVAPDAAIVPSKEILSSSFRDPQKRMLAFENPNRYRGKPRIAFAFELLDATRRIAAHMEEFELPFLIIHGELDTITDPAVSKELYTRSKSADKTIKLYPGGWHQLLCGEPDQDAKVVWSDVFSWLESRLKV